MRRVIWLLAMALALPASGAKGADCTLTQVASFNLTSDSSGDIIVPVTIGGAPKNLIFSMQAAFSVLSDATVASLGLSRKRIPEGVAINIKDQSATGLARAQVQLGGLTVDNVNFAILPRLSGVDGILAMDILRTVDVELDLTNNKLNLFVHDKCPGHVVYWQHPGGIAAIPMKFQKSGNIQVAMQLDGKPLIAGIDSDDSSWMGMNAAREIFGLEENAPGLEHLREETPDGKPALFRYAFKSLEMPGVEIANPEIFIFGEKPEADCESRLRFKLDPRLRSYRCFGGADLFLGLSVLRRLHLYFAFDEKVLYATAAVPSGTPKP